MSMLSLFTLLLLFRYDSVNAKEKTTSIPVITTNSDLLTEISAYLNGNTNSRTAIGTWDVSGLADFSYAFYGVLRPGFNEDISGWNVAAATNMEFMFSHAYTFNQDLSSWNVARVTNMQYMFNQAYAFNQDISGWDVSSVNSIQYMFHQAYAFNYDLCGWSGKLPTTATVTNTFLSSGCTVSSDPVLTASPQSPLCRVCLSSAPTSAPTTPEITITLPCFSPDVKIYVEGKGKTEMNSLAVGDKVLTASGKYQPVYMMTHFHHNRTTKFIQIHTNLDKEQPLEMTPNHMIFIQNKDYPIPAVEVRVGDKVQSLEGPAEVTDIRLVTRSGLYNPLTTDGTIVADGLVASTYTSYSGKSHIHIAGEKVLSLHTIMGLASDPYGIFCTTFSLSMCNQHEERAGITIAMRYFHDYWSKQSDFLKFLILAVYLMIFGLLNQLHRLSTIILGACAAWIYWMMMNKKNANPGNIALI